MVRLSSKNLLIFSAGDLIRVISPLPVYENISNSYMRCSIIGVGNIFIITVKLDENARGTVDGWYRILCRGSGLQAWGANIRSCCVLMSKAQ